VDPDSLNPDPDLQHCFAAVDLKTGPFATYGQWSSNQETYLASVYCKADPPLFGHLSGDTLLYLAAADCRNGPDFEVI
jgi:hypothetical protein